jgi:hypothetical protein
MNTTELALIAGLIYEKDGQVGVTYFTEGNFEQALDNFAELVIVAYKNGRYDESFNQGR